MRRKARVLRGVRANAGLEAIYRRRLQTLIAEMNRSVTSSIVAAYRRRPPELLAHDESPAAAMRALIRRLTKQWLKRFDDAAPKLAKWFATSAHKRSQSTLKKILKDGGFSVPFKMTRAQNDALQAVIGENVGLIKSIPAKYLQQVEGIVMRATAIGRDQHFLAAELEKQFGVTKRRAAFLARDQLNKTTAVVTRVQQMEAFGPDAEAVWCHSAGGKTPRPTHVKAGKDKQVYKVSEGWLDPAINKRIWPGTEINCRCFSRMIVPGFE